MTNPKTKLLNYQTFCRNVCYIAIYLTVINIVGRGMHNLTEPRA